MDNDFKIRSTKKIIFLSNAKESSLFAGSTPTQL
jgi:hypothetical protein